MARAPEAGGLPWALCLSRAITASALLTSAALGLHPMCALASLAVACCPGWARFTLPSSRCLLRAGAAAQACPGQPVATDRPITLCPFVAHPPTAVYPVCLPPPLLPLCRPARPAPADALHHTWFCHFLAPGALLAPGTLQLLLDPAPGAATVYGSKGNIFVLFSNKPPPGKRVCCLWGAGSPPPRVRCSPAECSRHDWLGRARAHARAGHARPAGRACNCAQLARRRSGGRGEGCAGAQLLVGCCGCCLCRGGRGALARGTGAHVAPAPPRDSGGNYTLAHGGRGSKQASTRQGLAGSNTRQRGWREGHAGIRCWPRKPARAGVT